MEFRWQQSDADLAGLNRVLSDVYQRGKPIEQTSLDPDEIGAVGVVDGEVGAAFLVMHMEVSRRAASIPCGGVAAVGVLPEMRHLQLGSEMMKWSLGAMRERGYALASLYPFRERFYRKFGYETAGARVMIECPRDRLPAFEISLPVRRITAAEVAQLNPALQGYAARHSGVNRRNPDNWVRRLGEIPPMIYAFGDPVEAYLWTGMDGGFWDDLSIGEFIYGTRRGFECGLGFMRTLGINRGALQWRDSSASPFLATLMDGNMKVSYDRPTMWRVLDVVAALSALKPEQTGEFCFRLHDELMAENDGVWQVRYSDQGVEVSTGGDPDFELDIRQFSQAFLGEPSLRLVADLGLVQVHRAAGLRAAEGLFTPTPVVCSEFF